MSLINDALKRAKEVQEQQQTSPSFSAAPLHVAPAPRSSHLWPMALVALALAVIMTGAAVWYSIRHQPASVQAKNEFAPSATIEKTPPVVTPAQAVVRIGAKTAPPVIVPAAPPKIETPAPPPVAKPAPVSEPPPSKAIFPSMRLQGILFDPKRPAAIVNGRTLYVGDTISGVVVTAITQDKATVAWNGMTNVLSLAN